MIGFAAAKVIGEHRRIDLVRLAGCPHRAPCGRNAVDRRAAHRPARHALAVTQGRKHTVDIGVQIAAIGGRPELRLTARSGDRHRIAAIFHSEPAGRGKAQPQVGMSEPAAVDHALLGVVAIEHAIQRRQKHVAIARRAGRSRCLRLACGPVDARRGVGVRTRPFGHRPRAAGNLRVEIALRRQRRQHVRQGARIISARRQIADAQVICLIFLAARKFERQQLAARADAALDQPGKARIAQQRAGQHLQQCAANRVALRRLLPPLAMLRGDVAHFMAQDACQFGLVIHQCHQLARHINIAAGNREGVIDRGIEQGDGKVALRIGQARLDRNPPPHRLDIARLRPGIRTAKFLQQFRMLLGTRRLVLLADRRHGADRPLLPDHRRCAHRNRQRSAGAAQRHLPVHKPHPLPLP